MREMQDGLDYLRQEELREWEGPKLDPVTNFEPREKDGTLSKRNIQILNAVLGPDGIARMIFYIPGIIESTE